ncbi:MAG: cell division FtsA domain-containing protein [Patescibacteria group bacterium]
MAQKISVGIDIGTSSIKVVVAESTSGGNSLPKIIGFGHAPSEGMRHGYIVDPSLVAVSLRKAIDQAQKTSGYKIEKAYFSIGGAGLEGATNSASISLGEKESVISQSELEAVVEACQEALPASSSRNRDVIHSIPLSYKIDGKPVYGKALGMTGNILEAKTLFITALTQHLGDLVAAAGIAEITIEDVDASPIAASVPLLSKSQLMAGCGLLIIGAETSAFAVFENGAPSSATIFPIGSSDVTNDLALGFKVSLEEAERIKTSRPESLPYPRKKIEEIIRARLEDIFDLVQAHLKKIGKAGLLPAGIMITGGGAQNPYVEEIGKNILKLPAKKVGIKFEGEAKTALPNAIWAGAYGLSIIGMSNGGEGRESLHAILRRRGSFFRNMKKLFGKLLP